MTDPLALADDILQELIDGRLEPRERERLTAALSRSPEVAARVAAMRRQHQLLKGIGREVLCEPVPERLRRVLARRGTAKPGRWRSERLLRFGSVGAAIVLSG